MKRSLFSKFGFSNIGNLLTVFFQGDGADPSNNTTVYFCSTPQAPALSQNFRAVISLQNGNIRSAALIMNTTAGNAGSGENISVYLRLNRTTDYLIKTVGTIDAVRVFDNYNLNIPIQQGDILLIKVVYPTWVTPPTNAHWSGNAIING